MKQVHCRKCWQPIPLFTKRCAQCGELNLLRFGKGLMEVLSYIVVGAAAVGVACWSVVRIMF